jgi:hypothetical protein
MDDCFEILSPIDSQVTPVLKKESWNLFEDYAQLEPAVVANHLMYSHKWLTSAPYVRENISYSYMFLKNNCDETLWNSCQDSYTKFPVSARGGPLMLILLLHKILNVTESALAGLVHKIQHLKISEIPGENVDEVVALVKAALKLVDSAQKQDKVRLPLDFPKTLLEVYQTSSVDEFNSVFRNMHLDARESQYTSRGGVSAWPDIDTINLAASAAYRDILQANRWNVPAAAKAQALTATTGKRKSKRGGKQANTIVPNVPKPPHCWNCDGEHLAKECPLPFNKDHFEANKKKWLASRGNRRPRPCGSKPVQDDKGRPLKLNKKGQYVVDSGKLVRMKKMESLINDLSVTMATTDDASTLPPRAVGVPSIVAPSFGAPSVASSTVDPDRVERNRAMLRERIANAFLV